MIFLKEYIHILAEVDTSIPQKVLSFIFLSTLPEKYNNFVVAIETSEIFPSLSKLMAKLLEEGKRRQSKGNDNHREEKSRLLCGCKGKKIV